MKKIAGLIILTCLVIGCAAPAPAAVKKAAAASKTAVKKKTVKKRTVRRTRSTRYQNWNGPRPVFPQDTGVAAPVAPPPPPPKPVVTPEAVKPAQTRSWVPKLGFGGGALILGADYRVAPMWDGIDLLAGAGYGIGNGYSVLAVNLGGAFKVKENIYVGASLDLANYSKSITNIAGISGTIDAGTKLGIGVFGGTVLNDKWQLQVGYSSALGLTARAGYLL